LIFAAVIADTSRYDDYYYAMLMPPSLITPYGRQLLFAGYI